MQYAKPTTRFFILRTVYWQLATGDWQLPTRDEQLISGSSATVLHRWTFAGILRKDVT